MSQVSIRAGQKLAPELNLDSPTNSYLGAALFAVSLVSQKWVDEQTILNNTDYQNYSKILWAKNGGKAKKDVFRDQRQTRTHNETMKEKEASFRKWRVVWHASPELTPSEVSIEEKGMIATLGKRYYRHTRGTHPREEENKSCHSLSPIPWTY